MMVPMQTKNVELSPKIEEISTGAKYHATIEHKGSKRLFVMETIAANAFTTKNVTSYRYEIKEIDPLSRNKEVIINKIYPSYLFVDQTQTLEGEIKRAFVDYMELVFNTEKPSAMILKMLRSAVGAKQKVTPIEIDNRPRLRL